MAASSLLGLAIIAALVFILPEIVRPYWPAYVSWLGGSAKAAFVWGPLLSSAAVTLTGNTIYAFIYAARIPALEAHRINRKSPWPWAAQSPSARAAFWRLTVLSMLLTTFNHALLLTMTWLNWPLAAMFGFRADVASFPGPLEVCAHLAIFALLEDAAFYWGHRILHEWPVLYRQVHKMHHDYTYTVSTAVLHLHPLEFLVSFRAWEFMWAAHALIAVVNHSLQVCNILPVGLGPLITGAHAYTGLLWVALRLAQTQEAHSGYAWPWSPFRWLPANGSGFAHDAHHSLNTGNYGR